MDGRNIHAEPGRATQRRGPLQTQRRYCNGQCESDRGKTGFGFRQQHVKRYGHGDNRQRHELDCGNDEWQRAYNYSRGGNASSWQCKWGWFAEDVGERRDDSLDRCRRRQPAQRRRHQSRGRLVRCPKCRPILLRRWRLPVRQRRHVPQIRQRRDYDPSQRSEP